MGTKSVPEHIMPNQITWIGLLSIVLSLAITIYIDPFLRRKSRNLALVNLILLIIYFSADFVDGIHARVTRQTSNLGALLDHGADSISAFAILVTLSSSLQLGIGSSFMYLGLTIFIGFYFVGLFIKYVGFMKLYSISGQSEGFVLVMLVHLISFLSPSVIQSLKRKAQHSLLQINTEFYLKIWVCSLFIYSFGEIIFYMIKKETIQDSIGSFIISSIGFLILLLFFYNIDYLIVMKSYSIIYMYLIMFSQSFTVCYFEETVSNFCSKSISFQPFITSYTLLSFFMLTNYCENYNISILVFLISTVHFFLRVGSILLGMSKGLNSKLFNKDL